jgi:hypothetical protein
MLTFFPRINLQEKLMLDLMFDFNTLAEFSRANCTTICAFLIPANIIASSLTIIVTVLGRPISQVWKCVGIASIFAVVMISHVYTWLMIGVVMLPTYILLFLAITCLLSNFASLWKCSVSIKNSI